MAKSIDYEQLAHALAEQVGQACPGVSVEAEHSPRWNRTCLTFRWNGFAGLLPEERFRIVAQAVPAPLFDQHCRGAVWLELADGETVDEYLKLPRSEDIDPKLPRVWAHLREVCFFAALEDELVRIPPRDCPNDLSISKRVLDVKRASAAQVRDAVLAFMRHEAYTDWEVLGKVRSIVEPQGKKKR